MSWDQKWDWQERSKGPRKKNVPEEERDAPGCRSQGQERRGPDGDGPGGRGGELDVMARDGSWIYLEDKEVRKTIHFLWIESWLSKKMSSRAVSPGL